MRCAYCGGKIEPGKEKEHEVYVLITGGRKSKECSGSVSGTYYCCSYECRVNKFDRVVKAVSEEELRQESLEEKEDDAKSEDSKKYKKTMKKIEEAQKLNKEAHKIRLQANVLWAIALVLNFIALLIHIIK